VFPSTQVVQRLVAAEAASDSATWAELNYDGTAGNPSHIRAMRRWHALRTVACSDAFRAVWGDDAMGSSVRVLIGYQYDNYQDTATDSLTFIDGYYGNSADANGKEAHPVSYYVWGGAAASYYGLENKTGSQTHSILHDPSFEKPAIPRNTRKLRPSGSPWTFRGSAGVFRPGSDDPIQGFERLVEPASGQQAAFIIGTGSISQRVRFAKTGVYAVTFYAAGHREGWPPHLAFNIYVDDIRVTPLRQTDLRPADEPMELTGWSRSVETFEAQWGSSVFRVDQPGERTIRFVGEGGEGYLLLEDVEISSVDAMFDGGFRGGEALGEVSGANLAKEFRSRAKYARTFGLQVVAYEAGWSVGGDFGQLPIQNWSKLKDDRAKEVNDRMVQLWDESGSFMNIWGVFGFWPRYDLVNAVTYPLMRSLKFSAERLRAEATSGKVLPALLRPKEADWTHVSKGDASWLCRYLPWCDKREDRAWFSWMLVAPAAGDYSVHVKARGDGSLLVEFDGETVLRVTEFEAPVVTTAVRLTKGAHAVRVVTVGDVEIQSVEIGN